MDKRQMEEGVGAEEWCVQSGIIEAQGRDQNEEQHVWEFQGEEMESGGTIVECDIANTPMLKDCVDVIGNIELS